MINGFLSIKFKGNAQFDLINHLTEVFRDMGIDLYCFVRDEEDWGKQVFTPVEVMDRALARIDRTEVMVVEFSEKGVGVGIEIGYAVAKNIPVIVIAPPEADISGTLQGVMKLLLRYQNPEDLRKEKDAILGAIQS